MLSLPEAARTVRRLARQVARSAAAAARVDGVTPLAQLVRLVAAAGRAPALSAAELYHYRLYLPERAARAADWIGERGNLATVGSLPEHAGGIWSKLEMRRAFAARGLAAVPILATLTTGPDARLTLEDGPALAAEVWRGDLIVKPDVGWASQDVRLWRDGPDALVAWARARPVGRTWVIQERLRTHPELAPISGEALGCLRITTYRRGDGALASILPTLKLGGGERVIDQLGGGNVAAPVDASGRLGVARGVDAHDVVHAHAHHPESGAAIEGRAVPYWDDAVALALRAHASFPAFFGVGWDIAITADGVSLVEGNRVFGVRVAQIAWDRAIGDTDYGAALRARLSSLDSGARLA